MGRMTHLTGEGFGGSKSDRKGAKGNVRGNLLSNEPHHSSTDPEALLARKSNDHPAQLSCRFGERSSRCDATFSWTTGTI